MQVSRWYTKCSSRWRPLTTAQSPWTHVWPDSAQKRKLSSSHCASCQRQMSSTTALLLLAMHAWAKVSAGGRLRTSTANCLGTGWQSGVNRWQRATTSAAISSSYRVCHLWAAHALPVSLALTSDCAFSFVARLWSQQPIPHSRAAKLTTSLRLISNTCTLC